MGALPEAGRCCGTRLGACPRRQAQGVFPSRVPAGPFHVSLPGVPQNSLSGQRPRRRLPRSPRRLPGAAARGRLLMLWFRCVFFLYFKSRSMVIKKGGAAALSSPAGAEGMLSPRRARDAGPRSLRRGLAPSPRPRKPNLPCWAGRPRAPPSFHLPSKASLQGGRKCHLRERLFKQHLPCLPLPLATALIPRGNRSTGGVWEEGGRTPQSPSPTPSFSLSVRGK